MKTKRFLFTRLPVLMSIFLALLLGGCPNPTDNKTSPPPDNITIAQFTVLYTEALDLLNTITRSADGSGVGEDIRWVNDTLFYDLEDFVYSSDPDKLPQNENDIQNFFDTYGHDQFNISYKKLLLLVDTLKAGIQTGDPSKTYIRGELSGISTGKVVIYSVSGARANSEILVKQVSKSTTWNIVVPANILSLHTGDTLYAVVVFAEGKPAEKVSAEASFTLTAAGAGGIVLTIADPYGLFMNLSPFADTVTPAAAAAVGASAVDDNPSTRWATGSTTPELTLAWDSPMTINWITIRDYGFASPAGRIKTFAINYWENGAWVQIYTQTFTTQMPGGPTGNDAYNIVLPRTITSEKLQLQVSAANSGGGGSNVELWEFETCRVPSREALQAKIAAAETALNAATVSTLGGDDVLIGSTWVTQSAKDALTTAITVAKGVNGTFNKTAQEITAAETDLQTALAAFVPADGGKTHAPTAAVTTAGKTATGASSVTFTLTGAYEAGAAWKVYDQAVGGTALTGVSAALTGDALTLSVTAGSLSAGDYWVSVTNSGKAESGRLKLTVTSPAGQTVQPVVSGAVVLKTAASATVDFTLTNSYTGTLVWNVYSNAAASTSAGITAALTGTKLTLTHTSDIPTGSYWVTVTEDTNLESDPVKLTVAAPLKLVRASIADTARTTLLVEFEQAVTIVDAAKFTVKVNDMPAANKSAVSGNAAPWLDKDIKTARTITAAAAAGAGGKQWNFTMSAPAQYGEIIRLAAAAEGGAEGTGYVLPKVPGLIVKNGVKRTKFACEYNGVTPAAPGFYRVDPQGSIDTPVTAATGANIWDNGRTYLYTSKPQDGYTYVFVIGEDQAPSTSYRWAMDAGFTFSGSQRSTIIITSNDNAMRIVTHDVGHNNSWTSGAIGIRGGITLIVDANITLQAAYTGQYTSAGGFKAESLIYAEDGSRIILDGGTLRGNIENAVMGGIKSAGANYGMFFIMNSGTITGMSSSVGVFGMHKNTVFVMHDGAITGNTTTNGTAPKAGGLFLRDQGTAAHGSRSFFMTGGSINGNTVGTGAVSAAGGVISDGEFQKTGGVIGGNTNNAAGNNKGTAVLVMTAAGSNNPAAGNSFKRDTDAGSDVTLFLECVKPATGTAGTITRPVWGADNWE